MSSPGLVAHQGSSTDVPRPGRGLSHQGNAAARMDSPACAAAGSHPNCSSCRGTTSPPHPPEIVSAGERGAELRQPRRHHPTHCPPLILDPPVPAVSGSSTTAPHRSRHHNLCGGIAASSCALVTVPWLCRDTAVVAQDCRKPFSSRAATTPEPQGSPGNRSS